MGSYNVTDALSMRQITPSQKCKIVFLVESQLASFTDCTYAFEPLIPVAVDATYDDYGRFIFNDTPEVLNMLTEIIIDNMVTIEAGDNEYHEFEVSPSTFTLDNIFKFIEGNRLFVKRSYTDKSDPYHTFKPVLAVRYLAIGARQYNNMLTKSKFEIYGEGELSIKDFTARNFIKVGDVAANASDLVITEKFNVLTVIDMLSENLSDEQTEEAVVMLMDKRDSNCKYVDKCRKVLSTYIPDVYIYLSKNANSESYYYSFFGYSYGIRNYNDIRKYELINLLSWISNYSNYTLQPSRYSTP